MQDDYIQEIVNRAARIATKNAVDGNPVAGIAWIPPQSSSGDLFGDFVVIPCPPLSSSDIAPWE